MVWGGMACHWRFARASNRAMLQIVGRKYCHGVGGLKYKGGEHLPVSDGQPLIIIAAMAYRVTLKLNTLSEPSIRRSSSPDDAARIAWQLLVDNDSSDDIFDSCWKMKTWDTMDGAYETDDISDHMVRGLRGSHPDDVEFKHCVVDKLTRDTNNSNSRLIYADANFPYTPEPEETNMIFEMTRYGAKEKLRVEWTKEKVSVVEEFVPVLKEVVSKAKGAGELRALATLLTTTLADIEQCDKQSKKKRPLQA